MPQRFPAKDAIKTIPGFVDTISRLSVSLGNVAAEEFPDTIEFAQLKRDRIALIAKFADLIGRLSLGLGDLVAEKPRCH